MNEETEAVLTVLRDVDKPQTRDELVDQTDLRQARVGVVLGSLRAQGLAHAVGTTTQGSVTWWLTSRDAEIGL